MEPLVPEAAESAPIVELPLDTVPVPVEVPVDAGLSELMLPLGMVLSGVVDDVALLCAKPAVLAPSKEMNTAIGNFLMLSPET